MFRFFPVPGPRTFTQQLNRVYAGYAVGLLAFIGALAVLEQMGLAKRWIGLIFVLATVVLYAGIGMLCRTTDPPSNAADSTPGRRRSRCSRGGIRNRTGSSAHA